MLYLCTVIKVTGILFGSVWLYSELMNLDNSSGHRKKAMRSSPVLYIYYYILDMGVNRYLIVSRQSRAHQLVS